MTAVLRKIGEVARIFDAVANLEFKSLALTRGQYLYLVRIAEQPGIILERLAAEVKVDRTTAARALQKLVQIGLVEKRRDAANQKNRQLFVTASGQQAAALIQRENLLSETTALQDFSPEQTAALEASLDQLLANVRPLWQNAKRGQTRDY
ncbi:MarR family winged helix-turn-helix transcriptional regulator [Lapidilactobacillus achengensis]|uniref:MarR family winged helix-turn-helix transcriptional regulator n=1 Tax=Lapidilactobacillus achengensis TaxID=2486000 RepID=A0ABW1US92_9LACO|nr:MarR family transcriptional regulator [Lapidilactobacillus achengensis]